MNEERFSKRIAELTDSVPDPRNSPTEDMVATMVREVEAKSGGTWDNDVALEVMRQFEWFIDGADK